MEKSCNFYCRTAICNLVGLASYPSLGHHDLVSSYLFLPFVLWMSTVTVYAVGILAYSRYIPVL